MLLPAALLHIPAHQRVTKTHIVAVSDSLTKQSWRPDGQLLKEVVGPGLGRPGFSFNTAKSRLVVVQVHSRHPNDMPGVAFMLDGIVTRAGYVLLTKNLDVWQAGLAIDTKGKAVIPTLKFGVAGGTWKTSGAVAVPSMKATGIRFMKSVTQVESKASGQQKRDHITVSVQIPRSLDATDFRIVATDVSGKILMPSGNYTDKAGVSQYWFQGQKSKLARVELKQRPYAWQTVRDVHMRPSKSPIRVPKRSEV